MDNKINPYITYIMLYKTPPRKQNKKQNKNIQYHRSMQ